MEKQQILIILVLCSALLFMSANTAMSDAVPTNWNTSTYMVSVPSGTSDINKTFALRYNPTSTPTNQSWNISLPFTLRDLDNDGFVNITTEAGSSAHSNLSINGDSVFTSTGLPYNVTSGTSFTYNATYTLADYSGAKKYLDISYNASAKPVYINVTVWGNDVFLDSDEIDSLVSNKKEKITTYPTVRFDKSTSRYTVHDKFTVTNNLSFENDDLLASNEYINLTDITLNISYPSNAGSTGSSQAIISNLISNRTTTAFTNGTSVEEVGYQKQGPYVRDIDEEVTGDTHKVTIEVRATEDIDSLAKWILDPTDSDYVEYFENFNPSTLDVEKDGNAVTWTNSSIKMEEMSLSDGDNTFVFEYTETVADTPTAEEPATWYEKTYFGMPFWTWLLMIAVIGIVIAVVVVGIEED